MLRTISQETYLNGSVTVLERAIPPTIACDIGLCAVDLLEAEGLSLDPTRKKFQKSKLHPIATIPYLGYIAGELLDAPLPKNTLRVNWQDPGGRQPWHYDYISEPLVIYPVGEGALDFAPNAETIEEARTAADSKTMVSVPLQAGDIAILHHGGTMFHRGRNLSEEEPRITLVLH
jgi:hypothetical protein